MLQLNSNAEINNWGKNDSPQLLGKAPRENMETSLLSVHLHVSLLMDKEKNSNLILSKAFKC